jgi:hypothetical protein
MIAILNHNEHKDQKEVKLLKKTFQNCLCSPLQSAIQFVYWESQSDVEDGRSSSAAEVVEIRQNIHKEILFVIRKQ